jgi:hypothetical protein
MLLLNKMPLKLKASYVVSLNKLNFICKNTALVAFPQHNVKKIRMYFLKLIILFGKCMNSTDLTPH